MFKYRHITRLLLPGALLIGLLGVGLWLLHKSPSLDVTSQQVDSLGGVEESSVNSEMSGKSDDLLYTKPKLKNRRKSPPLVKIPANSHELPASKSPSARPEINTEQVHEEGKPKTWASRLALSSKSRVIKHLEKLDKLPKIDEKSWIDDENEQKIKAFMTIEKDGDRRNIIVKTIVPNSSPNREFVQVFTGDELLVSFKRDVSAAEMSAFLNKYNLQTSKPLLLKNVFKFQIPNPTIERFNELLVAVSSDDLVRYAHQNDIRYASSLPNDPLFNKLWGLQNSGQSPVANSPFNYVEGNDLAAGTFWSRKTDCSSVPIAVLDTGVDPEHPDLKDNLDLEKARNFSSADPEDYIDVEGHGTHVSGTIGAVGNNNIGITGVCWSAKIIPVKVLGPDGGTTEQVADGMVYAAEQAGAKVLNLSLGGLPLPEGTPPSPPEVEASERVEAAGALMIMAAGNNGVNIDQNPAYPAAHDNEAIISVAAVSGDSAIAGFSNFGVVAVDIAAPGVETASTIPSSTMGDLEDLLVEPNQPYAYFQGTSMATPHVAGAVALFWAYAPELSAQQVKQAVLSRASVDPELEGLLGGGRVLKLDSVIDEVLANLELESTVGDLSIINSEKAAGIGLKITEKYVGIDKIELLVNDEVKSTLPGTSKSFTMPFNPRGNTPGFIVRLTDEVGRTVEVEQSAQTVNVEKVPDLKSLLPDAQMGDIICRFNKAGLEGRSGQMLYEIGVISEDVCRNICISVGPMLYSSANRIECGAGTSVFYKRSP